VIKREIGNGDMEGRKKTGKGRIIKKGKVRYLLTLSPLGG